jgi:membrane protease YdiL (CAAX protease family)
MRLQQLRAAIVAIWVVGGIATYLFSHQLNIPARIAIPVAAAFLFEVSLYAGMQAIPWTAPFLWASGSASYLIYSIPTGVFHWHGLLLIAGLTGIAVTWMRYAKPGLASDAAFLACFTAIYLSHVLDTVYLEPFPKTQTQALEKLMCFRLAVTCILQFRSHKDLGFGFIPTREDWWIGLRYFLYLMPVAALLVHLLHYRSFGLVPGFWWKAPSTFLAVLWFVGLAEEILFRGVLLHRLRAGMHTIPALLLSSVAFGLTHLWFTAYPNWKFVIIASVAGLFYGMAYLQARAVRASMVAHAFTVAAMRTFIA